MKHNLKSEVLEKRKALSKDEIKENSNKIKENLYSLPEFEKAKNILFYVSFNNEVDTHESIKELKNSCDTMMERLEKREPKLAKMCYETV